MMTKSNKRNILISLILITCIISTSLALLFSIDSKTNNFVAGAVDIDLWEGFDANGDGTITGLGSDMSFDKNNKSDEVYGAKEIISEYKNIIPGESVAAKPFIVNDSTSDAYVYMLLGVPTIDIKNIDAEKISEGSGTSYEKAARYLLYCYSPVLSKRQINEIVKDYNVPFSEEEYVDSFAAASWTELPIETIASACGSAWDSSFVDYKIYGTYENKITYTYSGAKVSISNEDTDFIIYGVNSDGSESLLEVIDASFIKALSGKKVKIINDRLYKYNERLSLYTFGVNDPSSEDILMKFSDSWTIVEEYDFALDDDADDPVASNYHCYIFAYNGKLKGNGKTEPLFDYTCMCTSVTELFSSLKENKPLGMGSDDEHYLRINAFSLEVNDDLYENAIEGWPSCKVLPDVKRFLSYYVSPDSDGGAYYYLEDLYAPVDGVSHFVYDENTGYYKPVFSYTFSYFVSAKITFNTMGGDLVIETDIGKRIQPGKQLDSPASSYTAALSKDVGAHIVSVGDDQEHYIEIRVGIGSSDYYDSPYIQGFKISFKNKSNDIYGNALPEGSYTKTGDIVSAENYYQADIDDSSSASSTYAIVENVSNSATTSFIMNSNGYYESTNNGINNSYSLCKLRFCTGGADLTISYINYAESGYDYGIFSYLDGSLSATYTADSSYMLSCQSSTYNKSTVQTLTYTIPDSKEHIIYIKYRKNSSTHSYNDSLQFKTNISSSIPIETDFINILDGCEYGFSYNDGYFTPNNGGENFAPGTVAACAIKVKNGNNSRFGVVCECPSSKTSNSYAYVYDAINSSTLSGVTYPTSYDASQLKSMEAYSSKKFSFKNWEGNIYNEKTIHYTLDTSNSLYNFIIICYVVGSDATGDCGFRFRITEYSSTSEFSQADYSIESMEDIEVLEEEPYYTWNFNSTKKTQANRNNFHGLTLIKVKINSNGGTFKFKYNATAEVSGISYTLNYTVFPVDVDITKKEAASIFYGSLPRYTCSATGYDAYSKEFFVPKGSHFVIIGVYSPKSANTISFNLSQLLESDKRLDADFLLEGNDCYVSGNMITFYSSGEDIAIKCSDGTYSYILTSDNGKYLCLQIGNGSGLSTGAHYLGYFSKGYHSIMVDGSSVSKLSLIKIDNPYSAENIETYGLLLPEAL